ncbi:outer membrane beta-barrel protein [Pleionea sediminis]|uniref:outer membrane beta-barrel protein n=1 Tax=Pleionea sediminis TaxID=2569479 RepID=UPI0011852C96|nr:outer membrane beta-barrel protein [Pleionea sediminis]
MKLSKLTGIILATSMTCSVLADDRGWYAGLDIGSTSYSEQGFEDSASSGSALGGWKFNKYFKLQGNLYSLGEYSSNSDIVDSVEMNGLAITAIGTLPLGEAGFELYGRAGLSIMNYIQNIAIGDDTFENKSTGDAIVTGFGATFTHPGFQRLTFHVGFENYYFETTNFSSSDNNSHSINNVVLGARFNF